MATKADSRNLTRKQLIDFLTKAGSGSITPELLQRQIDEGAPTNPDGTINLIHYAAWLERELTKGKRR